MKLNAPQLNVLLRKLIKEEKQKILLEADDKVQERNAQDIADILYHLDVATRHMDALVGFGIVARHADEVVTISSKMQQLAQNIREELGSTVSLTPKIDQEDKAEEVEEPKKVQKVVSTPKV